MEFLETLKGSANKFDGGIQLGSKDHKALRDAVVYLLDRIKGLEERLSPAVEPVEKPKKKK